MKEYILNRLTRNKKWWDYLDFRSLECQAALFFSILLIVLIHFLNVYETFEPFLLAFQNITLGIAQALIGMLGFVLAGIAIIISTLKKDVVKKIDQINGNGTVKKILSSFEFLALNISVLIVWFYILYLLLSTPSKLIGVISFNFIVFFTSYFFLFVIFYSTGLVSNCAKLFLISNTYEDIVSNEKNIIETANEIRIDFILNTLIQDNQISQVEFLTKLEQFVENSNVMEKEKIKNYFKNYYS
ncbi:hypothetical protein QUF84_03875 [Fictibacillus enclensis]|uniref:hypothetical protein n=1 Tax=Fictibacillus enclensis TaxID=1017270 RepID=UPI0025A16C14|nr:hypothetical protein [Fictibacillus enclensis]MDM5336371.1 hypothetical protein [Fictibacillus enclensis]